MADKLGAKINSKRNATTNATGILSTSTLLIFKQINYRKTWMKRAGC